MNVFLLPLDLCNELEELMNQFWWDQPQKQGNPLLQVGFVGKEQGYKRA